MKRDGLDRPIESLGIAEAGRLILHPPLKPRRWYIQLTLMKIQRYGRDARR
jgi:hypothetical protein